MIIQSFFLQALPVAACPFNKSISLHTVVVRLQNLEHFGAAELGGNRLVVGEHRSQPRPGDREPVLVAVRTGPAGGSAAATVAIESEVHF